MKGDIKGKTADLQGALFDLGKRLDNGEESQLLVWVIPGALACAHRPLRHHPEFGRGHRGRNLPAEAASAVLAWVRCVRHLGIRSVICLMHPQEFKHYARLDLGVKDLLDLYRTEGLVVRHIPWEDPAHRSAVERSSYQEELARVRVETLDAFDALPKPILLHCSAGMDRSSPVAAYIWHERVGNSQA